MKKIKDTQAIRVYIAKTGHWYAVPPKSITKEFREYFGNKKQAIRVCKNHLELLNALELIKQMLKKKGVK